MTKNEEFTEVLSILEDVYGWNDTNELTDIQTELVNDVISVVKKLIIPVVVGRSEQLFCQCTKPAIWVTDDGFNGCVKCNKEVKAK